MVETMTPDMAMQESGTPMDERISKIEAIKSKIESGYYLTDGFTEILSGYLIDNPRFIHDLDLVCEKAPVAGE